MFTPHDLARPDSLEQTQEVAVDEQAIRRYEADYQPMIERMQHRARYRGAVALVVTGLAIIAVTWWSL